MNTRAYDTARVLYRTVDPDGHIAYLQNFYSVPWQRIGELLPVRVTENELGTSSTHRAPRASGIVCRRIPLAATTSKNVSC